MDAHIKKVYVPMTETSFYILLCLRTPNHGYGIVQKVKELTDNEVVLGPGTMYGSLSKMEKDGLIHFIREEDKRKIYEITELGTEVLELELKRIRRLYRNAQEEMKELKKEFRWFNIMEYEKEENYLSKRHQEGWKFKRVTFPGVYTFERCESEKVIYQLDYNKEGIKHQMEYVRMFEDCGWEYLTEFDGYNYFRKPADKMQQEEEIFCDDISRLDMMNRIFIGRVIPLIVILCGLIWQFYISATEHSERGWLPMVVVLVVIYIITFLQFAVKYFAFRNKVKK